MFLEHSTAFPVFCCPSPNLLKTCCWHQIQKHIFTKFSEAEVKHHIYVFVLLSIEYIPIRLENYQILFYSCCTQHPNFLFGIRVVCTLISISKINSNSKISAKAVNNGVLLSQNVLSAIKHFQTGTQFALKSLATHLRPPITFTVH